MTALANAKTVGYPFKGKPEIIQVVYDFAKDGGTAGAFTALTTSTALLIRRCHGIVKTTCAGAGATVALGLSGGQPDAFLPAMDVADLAATQVIISVADYPIYVASAAVIQVTIAAANLTAGKIEFTFEVLKP